MKTAPCNYLNKFQALKCKVKRLFLFQDRLKVGRPPTLSDQGMLSVIIWSQVNDFNQDIKTAYNVAKRLLPKMPTYCNFVKHYNRQLPFILILLQSLLVRNGDVAIVDSTPLPAARKGQVASKPSRVLPQLAMDQWGSFSV